MAIKDYVERELICCEPESTLQEVALLMKENDVGAVLVISDDGEPVGIITDRDIVLRCVVDKKDCAQTQARDIMTDSVETVTFNDGIYNVIEKMRDVTSTDDFLCQPGNRQFYCG